ncbi:MAG: hypothetical protein BWY88_00724 [Synergistetes bacterium ADurb.Bin520]|nr:MAG: hypothetical protein BWY88_00724 [Synergistetes bacterium ADurb.Bin520]
MRPPGRRPYTRKTPYGGANTARRGPGGWYDRPHILPDRRGKRWCPAGHRGYPHRLGWSGANRSWSSFRWFRSRRSSSGGLQACRRPQRPHIPGHLTPEARSTGAPKGEALAPQEGRKLPPPPPGGQNRAHPDAPPGHSKRACRAHFGGCRAWQTEGGFPLGRSTDRRSLFGLKTAPHLPASCPKVPFLCGASITISRRHVYFLIL